MRTGTKLALLYALLFGLSILLLGGASLFLIDRTLRQQVDDRITAEILALTEAPDVQSADDILRRIVARKGEQQKLLYILRDGNGGAVLNDIAWTGSTIGWFDFGHVESGEAEIADQFRGFAVKGNGYDLVVAEDTDEIENIRQIILSVSVLLAAIAAALAGAGGTWLSRLYLGKLESFATQARAITAGDFSQRMPAVGSGDEFHSLSTSLNLMLDRNHELLQLQRRVTSDIAHDIRTPLTRMRQRLDVDEQNEATRATIADIDELRDILNALLRIAEIEEGDRRRNFKPVRVSELATRVVEIYAAAFDDQDKRLSVVTTSDANMLGDPELLTQMLVNLVENALHHTPRASHTEVQVLDDSKNLLLIVKDDGPGVPAGEEDRILQRFYRLDKSRTSQGSGLGLNLVKAIADVHGGVLKIENCNPGLRVGLTLAKFPASTA